jgi:hypothetical protein
LTYDQRVDRVARLLVQFYPDPADARRSLHDDELRYQEVEMNREIMERYEDLLIFGTDQGMGDR